MPFYRRKLVLLPLAMAIGFLFWRHYIFAPMSYRLDSGLIEAAETLHEIAVRTNEKSIEIRDAQTTPSRLQDKIPESLIDVLDSANIYVVYYSSSCLNNCGYKITFYIDRPFDFFNAAGPMWYYSYDSEGIREEEIVPSLQDAVRQWDESLPYYFFCQREDVENWFLCTSYTP